MWNTLKRLGGNTINRIIDRLNISTIDKYFSKVSTIMSLIQSTGYKGPLTEKGITNHYQKLQRNMMVPSKYYTIGDYVLTQQVKNEPSDIVRSFFNKSDEFINGITNLPLPEERWNMRNGKFLEKEKGRKFSIDFTKYNEEDKAEILKQMMEKFWTPFMKKITIEQQWVIKYFVRGFGWETTSIRADNIDKFKEYLDRQIWDTLLEYEDTHESDDAFNCNFNQIEKMEFIDYTEYPTVKKPPKKRGRGMLNTSTIGQPIKRNGKAAKITLHKNKPLSGGGEAHGGEYNAPVLGKKYGKRNGRFWKWTLDIPKAILNLERYQIYQSLTKETVKSMSKTHCLIHALTEYGIPDEITENIKTHITRGHFPMSKLKELSELTKINFKVRYYKDITENPKYSEYTTPDAKYTVNLILYEKHYMLDEEIRFNKNYIKLRKRMNDEPLNTKDWSLSDMLRVEKYRPDQKQYKKLPKKVDPVCSLPELLKTLFAYGYFKPITFNDYLVYYSSLYKDSLEESKVIAINEKDTRKITAIDMVAIEKDIAKNEKLLKKLDPKDYDIDAIRADIAETIRNDPSHIHQLEIRENGEVVDLVKERKPLPSCLIFADFECSTDRVVHEEYCICADKCDLNNSLVDHFELFDPENCAIEFLRWCQDGALIYFHNLSYDMNFLLKHFDSVKGNPIIFNGRDMSYSVIFEGKTLTLRDSYALISAKLEMFPSMFKLDSGVKEAFPYQYYTSYKVREGKGDILNAVGHVKPSLQKQFLENIQLIDGVKLGPSTFDMKKYALFYCNQDVKILRQGLCKFRADMLNALDIDCIQYVSISSVADRYFKREIYYKNDNLYEVGGVLLKNLSKCVHGGRCMTCDNQRQRSEGRDICDFDAVSLYPSAIHRLYNLEGKPKVIPNSWDGQYIIDHLFDEEQTEPTENNFISGFFVKIHIDEIGIYRRFPLIVFNPALNPDLPPDTMRSSNTCCTMWCDHITLIDLIMFQQIKFTLIGGYYYSGKRSTECREIIQKLFNLRLKYKAEDNPLQQVIKLILNSIYGKTILKPIEYKHVFIRKNCADDYLVRNFNEVIESSEINGSSLVRFKTIKPINTHYNFSPFGINILSMSKRIMNEVFCLAEDLGLTVFYQDTDSGHYYADEIQHLSEEYEKRYGRKLIGKSLGQFHSDFQAIDKTQPVAKRAIFLGKKSYIDMLVDDVGNVAFHARMKGITPNAIANRSNQMFPDCVGIEYKGGLYLPKKNEGINGIYSIYKLYELLYEGVSVEFDLVDEFTPCFDMKKDKTISTKSHFYRRVKF